MLTRKSKHIWQVPGSKKDLVPKYKVENELGYRHYKPLPSTHKYTHMYAHVNTQTHMNMHIHKLTTTAKTDKDFIKGPTLSTNTFLFVESVKFSSTHPSSKSLLSIMNIYFSMLYMKLGIILPLF